MVIVKTFLKRYCHISGYGVYYIKGVIALDVGEKIRTLRKFRKLTQVDVAQRAKIAVNSLRLYEAGKRTPNLDQLGAIATAMGYTLGEFLEGEAEKIFYAGADTGISVGEEVYKQDLKYQGYSFSESEHDLIWAFDDLNEEGQKKAIERVKELTEIPRYRRQDEPEPPPPPSDSKDAAAGENPVEGLEKPGTF